MLGMIGVKKKYKTTYGTVEIKHEHSYIKDQEHSFAISPLLQSHVLEFSSDQPFARGMSLLSTVLPGADIGSSQAQRLAQYFGELPEMEQVLQTPGFSLSKGSKASTPVLYVEVDGGSLLTDDGYKETKLGRIFGGEQRARVSSDNEGVEKRFELERSDFMAHLGNCDDFFERFDPLIKQHLKACPSARMVVLADGAEWMANWVERSYPDAGMILDFYHVIEKLGEFGVMVFNSKTKRTEWIEERKEELLNGKLDEVIAAIKAKAEGRKASIKDKAEAVTKYYENNRYRMKYDEYLAKGYCIGSGAIESAISTVVQQRCKLVGQRWTDRVQSVLNLRTAYKSGKQVQIRQLICKKMGLAIAC